MKNVILVILISYLLAVNAYSQQCMDTIELNDNLAATLIFSDNIEEIVYGNNPIIDIIDNKNIYKYYDEFRSKNKAVIASNRKDVPFTTISVILTNGDLYYGFLMYKEKPRKVFYPFEREIKSVNSEEQEGELYKHRLRMLMEQKQEYFDFGTELNKIEFLATNIMNDNKYTYIKLVVNNNSAGNYVVGGIKFKYEEQKNDDFKKRRDKDIERKNPIYEILPDKAEIPAYSSTQFGYVIPLFTTAQGTFIITCYNENGTREMEIKIRANQISKIKVF